MEATPLPGARFEQNGSAATLDVRSTSAGEPTASRLAKRERSGPVRTELGPIEVPPQRGVSGPTLAVAAVVAGCAAIGLGAWGAVRAVETNGPATPSPEAAALNDLRQATTLLARPTTIRLPVEHSGGHIVLAVGADGEAALVLEGLAAAPQGKTYQAWVVRRGSKQPVSAAVFSGTETVVPLGVGVPPAATVGVTVERAGGAPSPSRTFRITATRPAKPS